MGDASQDSAAAKAEAREKANAVVGSLVIVAIFAGLFYVVCSEDSGDPDEPPGAEVVKRPSGKTYGRYNYKSPCSE